MDVRKFFMSMLMSMHPIATSVANTIFLSKKTQKGREDVKILHKHPLPKEKIFLIIFHYIFINKIKFLEGGMLVHTLLTSYILLLLLYIYNNNIYKRCKWTSVGKWLKNFQNIRTDASTFSHVRTNIQNCQTTSISLLNERSQRTATWPWKRTWDFVIFFTRPFCLFSLKNVHKIHLFLIKIIIFSLNRWHKDFFHVIVHVIV